MERCDYMIRTILDEGSVELIWLVETDRITITKAFQILPEEDQICALREEFALNGWVQGMYNANDLFIIPKNLYKGKNIE
jgi:hypothetical protein